MSTPAVPTPSATTALGFGAQAGLVALAGTGLALFGAFGTDALPLWHRLAYWIGGLLAGGIALQVLRFPMRPVCDLLRVDRSWSYLLALPLLGALVVLGFAGSGQAASGATLLFAQVLLLGLALFALFAGLHWLGYRRAAGVEAPPAHTDTSATPTIELPDRTGLHERLPAGFGPVHALTVEDHYVRAIGEGRHELVLVSLAEAIALIGPERGMRLHRSAWAAHGAITRLERRGRDTVAHLIDGSSLPVGRTRLAAVREAMADAD